MNGPPGEFEDGIGASPPGALAVAAALFAATVFVFFCWVFVHAASFTREAALFPRLIASVGIVSAFLTLVPAVQTVFIARRREQDGGRQAAELLAWRDLTVIYASPPVYGVLLYGLGFWIASAVFLVGLLAFLGERRLVVLAGVAFGTLAVVYLVFVLGFDIRLPEGPLPALLGLA